MAKKRLAWKLFNANIIVTLLALTLITGYTIESIHGFYYNQVSQDLEVKATIVKHQLSGVTDFNKVNNIVQKLSTDLKTRITIILADGMVIADSKEPVYKMKNHLDRPEIIQALGNKIGKSTRYSFTLKKQFMYIAIPLIYKDKLVYIIRTSLPLESIDVVLKDIILKILLCVLVITVVVGVLSYLVSKKISQPLEQLEKGVYQLSKGDLQHRIPSSDIVEIESVANAINKMAKDLNIKIEQIRRQRNEQEAVFSSMSEGVIAIDSTYSVINMNHSARKLLQISETDFKGKNMIDIITDTQIQAFIKATLQTYIDTEETVSFYNNDEQVIKVHGTQLKNSHNEKIGAVVVLKDITDINKLENIRQEFVANVSHELKTPITTIKGFIETLKDGAVNDKEEAIRFLSIILRHVDRLDTIIDDLLKLSRLEQKSEIDLITFEETSLNDILSMAIENIANKSEEKLINISLKADKNIKALVNPSLMEQAIVNLIDNAIKYSNNNAGILVKCEKIDNEIIISVIDKGCGIAKEHLDHLFERFYRTDKARSRKMGGTGLGLSIVKHIIQIHNGCVTVQSEMGQGSNFSIHLKMVD